MIRLKRLRDPVWVDLGRGVRVQLRRLTSLELAAAEQSAKRRMSDLRRGEDVLEEYGLDGEASADPLADLAIAAGLGELIALTEMALRGVMSWEGVYTDEGKAAPTRAVIMQIVQDAEFRRRLLAGLTEACMILVAEGNGYAGSDIGSGPADQAAVQPTAPAAAPMAPPAPLGCADEAGDCAHR